MCTQIEDNTLYEKHRCKALFTAMMCTQVRFCVWDATLLTIIRACMIAQKPRLYTCSKVPVDLASISAAMAS